MRAQIIVDIDTDATPEAVQIALNEEFNDFEFFPLDGNAAIYSSEVIILPDDD